MESRAIESDDMVDPGYTPEQAVLGYKDSGPEDSNRWAVLLPPWHTHQDDWHYTAFAGHLNRQGFAVRRYDFSDHILQPDLDSVLASFHHIQDVVTEDLEDLTENTQLEEFHLVSASLGTVSLALLAERLPRFTGATIIAGSSDLARSMWHGSRTVKIRQELEKQGVDEKTIVEAWQDLAPKNHTSAFKGKPVNMTVSLTDKIIPTIYQHEMAEELGRAGSNVRVKTTRRGHYATIGIHYHFPGKLAT